MREIMGMARGGKTDRTHETVLTGWRLKTISCGLVGVALLLVLAPAAQAAQAGPAHVTIKAPYLGATGFQSRSTSSSGCGAGIVTHAPFFNAATGGVGFSVRSHADGCAPTSGDSGAASASETVTVPISVISGTDIIHATWSIDAKLQSSIGTAACTLLNASYSYCSTDAYTGLYGTAYLYDTTNDSFYSAGNYFPGVTTQSSLEAFCFSGNCSVTFAPNAHLSEAATFDWTFHAHGLVASHAYVLEFYWSASVSVTDFTYLATLTGATESASLSMAGPGLGATLESITIR